MTDNHPTSPRPVAFAQVREDPRLDLAVLRRAARRRHGARVLMVASGGCTMLALLGRARLARLVAVDLNPAQLDLVRVKGALLARPAPERRALLGHRALAPEPRLAGLRRAAEAAGVVLDGLAPPEILARRGLDFAGRYEEFFARLAGKLQRAGLLLPMLRGAPLPETAAARAALHAIFEEVFALSRLTASFGAAATANRRHSFAEHFLRRFRLARRRTRPARNPFLRTFFNQPLDGGVVHDWHALPAQRMRLAPELVRGRMSDFLRATGETFDCIHLSNIADWLPEPEARELLDLTAARLAPGGTFILRQLNSTLALPALGGRLRWDRAHSRDLEKRDRSFFYPRVWTGGRR